MSKSKLGILAYLTSLRASLDHTMDGNTVALVDRAAHALGQIEGAKFEAHDNQDEGNAPVLTVTEGHIGAPGNDHLTEADIAKPLDLASNTVSTDAPPPTDEPPVDDGGPIDPNASAVPPAKPPMFTPPPNA